MRRAAAYFGPRGHPAHLAPVTPARQWQTALVLLFVLGMHFLYSSSAALASIVDTGGAAGTGFTCGAGTILTGATPCTATAGLFESAMCMFETMLSDVGTRLFCGISGCLSGLILYCTLTCRFLIPFALILLLFA